MGVRYAAHIRESLIKLDVRGGIARRAQIPFHDFSVEVDDDHIALGHVVVGDPARLDDDEAAFTIDLADVPPCKEHELVLYEIEIRL